LQTMRFAHEIVDAGSLNFPKKAEMSKKEMDLANTLIDSMSEQFDPKKYKDEYYDKVLEVIRMKVEGVAPQAPAGKATTPTKVIDLMEILKQSLKETQKKGASTRGPASEEEEAVAAGAARSARTARSRKAR